MNEYIFFLLTSFHHKNKNEKNDLTFNIRSRISSERWPPKKIKSANDRFLTSATIGNDPINFSLVNNFLAVKVSPGLWRKILN